MQFACPNFKLQIPDEFAATGMQDQHGGSSSISTRLGMTNSGFLFTDTTRMSKTFEMLVPNSKLLNWTIPAPPSLVSNDMEAFPLQGSHNDEDHTKDPTHGNIKHEGGKTAVRFGPDEKMPPSVALTHCPPYGRYRRGITMNSTFGTPSALRGAFNGSSIFTMKPSLVYALPG